MEFNKPKSLNLAGDLAKNFNEFQEEVLECFEATETGTKSAGVQIARLKNLLGRDAVRLYKTLTTIKPEEETVNDILSVLKSHCIPKKNETILVFNFFNRKQCLGEPFENFYAELRALATPCEFGDQEDKLLRAQIILGVNSQSIKQHLLREDTTLNKVVEYCKSVELAEKNLKTIEDGGRSSQSDIFKVSRKTTTPQPSQVQNQYHLQKTGQSRSWNNLQQTEPLRPDPKENLVSPKRIQIPVPQSNRTLKQGSRKFQNRKPPLIHSHVSTNSTRLRQHTEIMTGDEIIESVVDEQQGDEEDDDETGERTEDETVPSYGEAFMCFENALNVDGTATRMRRCTTACCQVPAGSCGTETSDFFKATYTIQDVPSKIEYRFECKMGRTGRRRMQRLKDCKNPIKLCSQDETIQLTQWMTRQGCVLPPNMTPAIFEDTGRGDEWKTILEKSLITPDRDSNLGVPVIASLVKHKNDALFHAAIKTGSLRSPASRMFWCISNGSHLLDPKKAKRPTGLSSPFTGESDNIGSNLTPKIPPVQIIRQCFHPGTMSISKETVPEIGKVVSNMDMLKSMMSYIWPQSNAKVTPYAMRQPKQELETAVPRSQTSNRLSTFRGFCCTPFASLSPYQLKLPKGAQPF
uniref:Uncharacterized protein n=1 Tax=Timema bartmani TaxID=61472 RepID=A0A7R9HWW2_9NEOP|nr:unnamed protein product [Timema bartmani]